MNLVTGTINDIIDIVDIKQEVTYSELKSLRDNGELVPGQLYRITDYETTVSNYNNATSAGHKFDVIVTAIDEKTLNESVMFKRHNGDTYFADTNFNLWSGKYCFDMDSGRFNWVPSMDKKIQVENTRFGDIKYWATRAPELDGTGGEFITNIYAWKCDDEDLIFYSQKDIPDVGDRLEFKNNSRAIVRYKVIAVKNGATQEEIDAYRGVIYGLKDEWGNECGYDFKNIQFKRYAQVDTITLDDGNVCTFNGAIVGMDNTFFEWYYNNMMTDVEIRRYTMERNPTTDSNVYNDIKGTPSENTITEISKSYVSTIESDDYQYCYPLGNGKDLNGNSVDATLNGDNNNNVFAIGDNSLNNTVIGANCINNKFGLSFNDNTFGDFCSDNTFGNRCGNNHFGNDCYNNTFGNSCGNNHFGNNCGGSLLDGGGNTFGDWCSNNTFGNDCNNNTFGNSCYSNSFADSCYNNTFGNRCNGNQFGNDCGGNQFGNNCGGNQFGNDCGGNQFGNDCNYNTFGNNCGGGGLLGGGNTFGDYCNNNTFGNRCNGNQFGNNCYNNNFEVSCYNNILGDWCNGNQFNNDYIRYFNVHNYVQNCMISGYTTGEMNYLQNVEIANFTTNATISGLTPGSSNFVTCGRNSSGTLITKNPFDNN
jgi:hypothetical protein